MNKPYSYKPSEMSLSKLLDIPVFQDLSDSFFEFSRLPAAIADLNGNALIASGWQRICTEFHRKNSDTASRCLESDTILAGQLTKGHRFNIYKCKNGLIDVAAPIIIENIHLGNIYTGQFLLEEPNMDFFAKQADEFGFDKTQYLDALANVPVISENQIKKAMEYFTNLTIVIGSAGIDKKKLLNLNKNLEKQVHNRTVNLEIEKKFSESLINSLPGIMYVFDQFGHFKHWNQNLEKITGYSKEQILKMNPIDFIASDDKVNVKKAIDQVLEQGHSTIEAEFSTISGQIIPFLLTGFKYILQDMNYVIGVGLDISMRVKAETEKANLIKKLQETISEVKQLSGLLPICASCKKIRDDKGYWTLIESYIQNHSEAEFSHGMCPDCSEKFYGDEEWYISMKKNKNKQ
ncbi:MAG: PocR ligand-binding domain-containing protein [Pseudomonadota bacterium]